ncbi:MULTISPECIES: L-rhamnose mutarotase [Sphingomonas]|nr:L-rhamnose mutarotase [Sphingomonas bisphenolicum]MBA4089066.1 L-rhamnose mutarotase [Sphingobium sp.]
MVDLVDEPDSIARYREWHKPGGPPQAVSDAIRADGVTDLQIWMIGDRMVMIMEQDIALAPDGATKRAQDAANPDVQAWDALMRTFQRPLPFAPNVTWAEMERIYALDEQP